MLTKTRERLAALGLDAAFPATVWDVDRPADWQRFQHERRQIHTQRSDASLTLSRRLP
jgi:glycosyltransferase A (GT-A) superfamily protein (DUF2064 family)